MTKKNEHGLTDKQQIFADAYLCDHELNATKAYMVAYPKCSATSAKALSSKLLTNVNLKKYISDQKQSRSKRTGIDSDWVLDRLAEEAEADLADIFNAAGELKIIHQWPKIWRQGLVAGVDTIQIGDDGLVKVNKIKLSDRVKRLELIGKHVNVNAFVERQKVEVDANVKLTDTERAAKLAGILSLAEARKKQAEEKHNG